MKSVFYKLEFVVFLLCFVWWLWDGLFWDIEFIVEVIIFVV